MKISFYFLLIAALVVPATTATTQETPAEQASPPDKAALEASAAAAAEGEAIEREEEENNRRRRTPSETKIDLGNEQAIRVTAFEWPVDGPDYPRLAELAPGDVAMITASAPPKLWTHVDLMFGDLAVKAGNVAENYPGVYGLWLRKTDDGWNLIFNNKPDVWGTMYDPKADAGEVPLEYAVADSKIDAFSVELKETGEGAGLLEMAWGEHKWSTPFTYGG